MSSPAGALVADPGHAPDATSGQAPDVEGAAGQGNAVEQDLTAVLPADWTLIGRCRTGDGTVGDEGGCFVVAHAAIGVALVDLAPCNTPDAELRLRRLLNLVDFAAAHRGYLPIVHCRVDAEGLDGLMRRLDAAFAYEPRLGLRRRTTWVAALRRVLRASGSWESIGQPLPISWGEAEDGMDRRPGAGLMPRGALAAMALLATFGAGLASGLLWVPPMGGTGSQVAAGSTSGWEEPPAPEAAAPQVVAPQVAAPGRVPPGTLRDATPETAREAGDSARLGYRVAPSIAPAVAPRFELPAPASSAPGLPVLPLGPPPLLSASIGGMAVSEVADAGAGLTGAVPQSGLPMGPSLGPQPVTAEAVSSTAPVRRAREPLPIDRRCSDAVFRYQQGASLSEVEMGYVRRGCASWR